MTLLRAFAGELLLCAALALPGFAMPQDSTTSPLAQLQGATFQLEQATVQGATVNVPKNSAVRIVFDARGRISGQGPVNSYQGRIQFAADGSFAWQRPGILSTRRAGPQELMDFEQQYLSSLERTSRLTFIGGTLTLSSESGETRLVYAAITPSQALAPWLGRKLALTGLRASGRSVALPGQPVLEITLAAGGACSGFSGVNTFSGKCAVDESGRLQSGPFVSTMIAGPPQLSALETAFHTALAAANRVGIVNGKLRFSDETGQNSLTWEMR
ncbi:MAG: META domain-containing protein [Acidobacteria bacterium]|nr:META domain-containing protein [Acidobacteriota bacterium]